MKLSSYIDHTILKPTTTEADIEQLCQEAVQYQFAALCVPPYYVAKAKSLCKDSNVQIATVIGFPFGYSHTSAKKAEIDQAIKEGADEIDMVANITAIKSQNWTLLSKELSEILQVIRLHNKSLKWIIESGDLTESEIIKCCELANMHQIDYLKTSTGYGSSGASVKAVQIMKRHLLPTIKIKASGGIRDRDTALEYIQEGVSRIGTSSGVAIVG